jgi:hypothetical protein
VDRIRSSAGVPLIDPISGIARGEQADKMKDSLAAFRNILYVRNGIVE